MSKREGVASEVSESRQALYEQMVDEHSDDLFRLAYRLCGDRCQAEDLVQETFVQAWRSLGTLRDRAAARGWLAQILRHVWYRFCREQRRQPSCQDVALEDVALYAADEPQHDDVLQTALDQLSPAAREAFLMVTMGGFQCAEVADMQQVPLGTVLSRIHRARLALQKWLDGQRAERPRLRVVK